MGCTTRISPDGTTNQDTTMNFDDGRIWRLSDGQCLRIRRSMFGVLIYKQKPDDEDALQGSILSTSKESFTTLCINKTEDIVYVVYLETGSEDPYTIIESFNLSDLSPVDEKTLSVSTIPKRAIMDDDRGVILILGEEGTLYSVNLEGQLMGSVDVSNQCTTFCMDKQGNSYLHSKEDLIKVDANMVKTILPPTQSYVYAVDSFFLNDTAYFLTHITLTESEAEDEIQSCLWEAEERHDMCMLDADGDYEAEQECDYEYEDAQYDCENNGYHPDGYDVCIISYNTTTNIAKNKYISTNLINMAQFNTLGVDNKATFFGVEDGEGEPVHRYQVDLEDKSILPYRWEEFAKKQIASNNPALEIVCYDGFDLEANNCDTTGLITK